MGYAFDFLPAAEKQLGELDPIIAARIVKKLAWIAVQANPLRFGVRLLNSDLGDIRFRIGDYRVIALVDTKKRRIVIAAVGHRREIYK